MHNSSILLYVVLKPLCLGSGGAIRLALWLVIGSSASSADGKANCGGGSGGKPDEANFAIVSIASFRALSLKGNTTPVENVLSAALLEVGFPCVFII